jgi:hypothetical protein
VEVDGETNLSSERASKYPVLVVEAKGEVFKACLNKRKGIKP